MAATTAEKAVPGDLCPPHEGADAPIISPQALFRKRFLRHRLATASLAIIVIFYVAVIFANFLAYSDPTASDAQRSLVPPQKLYFFDDGRFYPHVLALERSRNPETHGLEYTVDRSQKIRVGLFVEGYPYKLFGVIPTRVHLLGTLDAPTEQSLFLLGSDEMGRDLFSRMMLAIRTSLLIGLAAVAVSIVVGMVVGAVSGFYGGLLDTVIQRAIEILRSIPTIPLWMGLAAAIPATWEPCPSSSSAFASRTW